MYIFKTIINMKKIFLIFILSMSLEAYSQKNKFISKAYSIVKRNIPKKTKTKPGTSARLKELVSSLFSDTQIVTVTTNSNWNVEVYINKEYKGIITKTNPLKIDVKLGYIKIEAKAYNEQYFSNSFFLTKEAPLNHEINICNLYGYWKIGYDKVYFDNTNFCIVSPNGYKTYCKWKYDSRGLVLIFPQGSTNNDTIIIDKNHFKYRNKLTGQIYFANRIQ